MDVKTREASERLWSVKGYEYQKWDEERSAPALVDDCSRGVELVHGPGINFWEVGSSFLSLFIPQKRN